MDPEETGESLDDLTNGLLSAEGGETQGEDGEQTSEQTDDATEGDEQSEQDQADEPEGDGGDEEEVDDQDEGQPDTEPRYTVKLNDGKSEAVTLKEALAGYQRLQDYTRKTQELADSRKAIEQEVGQARAARDQYAAVLKTLQDKLDAVEEPSQEQWNKLREEDPVRYAAEYTDFQRRQNSRAAISAEQQRVDAEKVEEQKKQLHDYLGKERDALLTKLPEWKDQTKYEAGAKALFEHAKATYGFKDEELNRAFDHRFILAMEDARKYHALVAKQDKAKEKLQKAPEVPPRARQPQMSKKTRDRLDAEKRFNRTGRIDDAVELMFKQ